MIINPILLKILFFLIKEVYINMDIRILRYFLTVAKEQNFTKAAEQLNITQPTLSRQLAAFEEELDTALFIRESRSITLTKAGVMAIHGLGYPVSIEGATKYWREDLLIQRRLYPEITASTVIAWRRNIPYSLAMNKFIEEINAFKA